MSESARVASDGEDWQLLGRHINGLQQQSIESLVERCKQAHSVDVHVRINGKWEIYQADWIKWLEPLAAAGDTRGEAE